MRHRGTIGCRYRGFSLVEMLLAVFILGIGVISISALFPAGIVLQRKAADDVYGPLVAQNAFALLRSRVSQDDFGSFQDFTVSPAFSSSEFAGITRTSGGVFVLQLSGDWGWMRPGFLFGNPANPGIAGSIDIFSANHTRRFFGFSNAPGALASEISADGFPESAPVLWGIPYNLRKYPLFTDPTGAASLDPTAQRILEPAIIITQAERGWPQGGTTSAAPLYHWDCMFRRSGGRVQVAVFVYRVTRPGGQEGNYAVAQTNPALVGTPPAGTMLVTSTTPPIPMNYSAPNLGTATSWPNRTGANARFDEIPGTGPGTPFGIGRTWDDWMAPGQVWIDNHGTVHEVLRGRLVASTTTGALPNQGPVILQRPIPVLPASPINGFDVTQQSSYPVFPPAPSPAARRTGPNGWIGGIWFVPSTDAQGNVITPVYATVEEL